MEGLAMSERFCRLCCEQAPETPDGPWNTILARTPEFRVVPTLGSMVEGWVMIVPNEHHLCFGAMRLDQLRRLAELKRVVMQFLRSEYGSCVAFEHGPSRRGTVVGCGVDHAHLHLVPLGFNLEEAVSRLAGNRIRWSKVGDLSDCRSCFSTGMP
jgi:ATP adenylyltransferase